MERNDSISHSKMEFLARECAKEFVDPEKQNDIKFSIIIPTYNCASWILPTLESLSAQDYPNKEIIIVDGGSTDGTLEEIESFSEEISQVHRTERYHYYEMCNRGIALASGSYIQFLSPGYYYLFPKALSYLAYQIRKGKEAHLLYSGSFLRQGQKNPSFYLEPLTLLQLQEGEMPTALEACFFHASTFATIGNFNQAYHVRGDLDLLGRFCQNEQMRAVPLKRILCDCEEMPMQMPYLLLFIWENMRFLRRTFGFKIAFFWSLRPKNFWWLLQRQWQVLMTKA